MFYFIFNIAHQNIFVRKRREKYGGEGIDEEGRVFALFTTTCMKRF
jgi:hypothetical protein